MGELRDGEGRTSQRHLSTRQGSLQPPPWLVEHPGPLLVYLYFSSHPGEWAERSPAQPRPWELGTIEKGIQGTSGGSFSFHLKPPSIMVFQFLLSSVDSVEISHWLILCLVLPESNLASPKMVEVFSFHDKPSPSFTLLT